MTKQGSGTLTLSSNNAFTGGATVSDGVLKAAATGALGSATAVVQSGAQLALAANGTFSNALSIGGSGIDWAGAVIVKDGHQVVLTGAITLTDHTNIKIRETPGGTLTIQGGITGNFGLSTYNDVGDVSGFVIETNPVNIGGNWWQCGGVTLNVAGNSAGALVLDWGKTMRLGVDNPFPATTA